MENRGYTLIQDWMLDLPLSYREIAIYAIIYGFSQDSETKFEGSLGYLASKIKSTRDTARNALRRLMDCNLIERTIINKNGVEFHAYKALYVGGGKIQGGVEFFKEGGGKIQPNNKEYNKDIKNISNKGGFDFYTALTEMGVTPQTAKDWLQVRKAKRAANTATALAKIKAEIAKTGLTAEECIKVSAENSWQGFKAEWLQKQAKAKPAAQQESTYEHNRRLMAELMGAGYNDGGLIDEQ